MLESTKYCCNAMCVCKMLALTTCLIQKNGGHQELQGSWKSVSCTRLKGERGGVHFLKAFLLGGLRPVYRLFTSLSKCCMVYKSPCAHIILFESC